MTEVKEIDGKKVIPVKYWESVIGVDENGDHVMEIPDEFLEFLNAEEGDWLNWIFYDEYVVVSKKNTEETTGDIVNEDSDS